MNEEIQNSLTQFIASKILRQPNRKINPTEPLLTSGLIDSFHLVDLGIFVEDTYGVRIDDSELNSSTFDTLDQLVSLIESRKS